MKTIFLFPAMNSHGIETESCNKEIVANIVLGTLVITDYSCHEPQVTCGLVPEILLLGIRFALMNLIL